MKEVLGPDIKAVFFDFDDTLIGTIENKWKQHKLVARKWYGKELSDEELREHWGKPTHLMASILYETDDTNLALERNRLVRAKFPKLLFDHTLQVVEGLRLREKLTGVVTAHSREGLQHDLNSLAIPPELFDYIQTSDDTQFHKPNSRVFDPAIEWLRTRDIQPPQTLYVGDGLLDMEAAQGAGLQFIGVETGLITAEKFRSMGAVAIKDLSYLIT